MKFKETEMSDAICPKCHEKIEPFAMSLAFFHSTLSAISVM
ncbi:hypothetical protein [Pseudoalteromonas phenolica]|nr:hypothetical protein [Pseudoalteromonas phenolica]